MKNKLYILFCFAALMMLLVPGILTIATDEDEVKANQTLTAFPELKDSETGELNTDFLPELSDYFSDHFAFRQELITLHSELIASVFSTSASDSVIIGDDGYLFYGDEVASYVENTSLDSRRIFSAALNLSLMQEYAESLGSEFYFTVAPNKSSIYPEKMPYNYIQGENTVLSELEEYLDELNVNYIDLKAALTESEDYEEVLYHKLDSHWNNLGASAAYDAIETALGTEHKDFTSIAYLAEDDFDGDLYEMLYPEGTEKDTNYYFDYEPAYQVVNMTGPETPAASTDITFETKVDDGSVSDSKLLMFRDSFGNALAPLLAEDYSSALFKRAVPYDLTLAETASADKVVVEIVERNIKNLSSDAVGASALAKFPAPVREIEPDKSADCGVLINGTAGNLPTDLLCLAGILYADTDTESRIYVKVGDAYYEASLCGTDEDGGEKFTLYLNGTAESVTEASVVFEKDGALLESSTVDVVY